MALHSTARTSDFSKYLGFRHEGKTLLNLQANAEAEQFMRVLTKLYQISKLTGSNFKQEVFRFLRAYRATPHCTTKVALADLMYSGHKFRTRLPIGVTPREHNFEELFQRDLDKMQMKGYADNKRYVKPSDIQVGDSVRVPREAINKTTPAYEAGPLRVQYRQGTRVVAKRPDGRSVTRTTAHFKKVPFRSMEEAHKWSSSEWPTETINESPPRIREDESLGLEQADESMTVNEPIPTEAASPVRLSPPLAREEGPRRS